MPPSRHGAKAGFWNHLTEVTLVFLRLGATAFGGPAAHIALMRDELVRRRQWLSDSSFMDAVGAVNLIPGPNSTELAMHAGHRRAGRWGLIAAGVAFILPAAIITTVLAWAYVRYGTSPAVDRLLYGVKPVMIAVIAMALWGLRRAALHSPLTGLIGATVLALSLWPGVNELVLLFAGGGAALLVRMAGRPWASSAGGLLLWGPIFSAGALTSALAAVVQPFSLGTLFLSFLKIGAVLYGSGYVLLAFVQGEFVTRLGWLTEQQVLDAIAAGQVTPGPVFTAATFIGYISGGGLPGAVLATVGIFLPAFVFAGSLSWAVPRIRGNALASAALDGINAASLGLMAAVAYRLGRASLIDALTVAVCVISATLLIRTRLNSVWLIAAGGAAGLAYRYATG